jgi:hypothetical protein
MTRIPKAYAPKGAIVPLMEAVAAKPAKRWTYEEAGNLMGMKSRRVSATVTYAVQAGLLYRGKWNGQTAISGVPFPPEDSRQAQPRRKVPLCDGEWPTTHDDPRVPKVVPGWVPPKMNPPRAVA